MISIETDSVADRQRVAYRFHGRNQDGPFVVEQQVYYSERDGGIDWMRVVCSGFRPPVTARLDCSGDSGSDRNRKN